MAAEITEAAISLLRAKALEVFGVIKDIYARPSEEGDADKIANYALKLVQYEGAMLTLQQYFGKVQQPAPAAPQPPPVQQEQKPLVVTEEMSPTLRRANAAEKLKQAQRKKKVEEQVES